MSAARPMNLEAGERLRAAVIGCGLIGATEAKDREWVGILSHAEGYRSNAGTELVAVCDISESKAREAAERWEAGAWYDEIDRMLAEARPDVVSICTPNATHAAILERVLGEEKIRGVLLEKPVAETVPEARRLAALARERGVPVAVNYSRRYCPAFVEMRERIRAREFGRLQAVTGYYTKGIVHNGSHWIDLLRFFAGEIRAVRATEEEGKNGGRGGTPKVLFEMENGLEATLVGCDAEAFTVFEMDVMGTMGRVRMIEGGHRIEVFAAGDSRRYGGHRELELDAAKGATHTVKNAIVHAIVDLCRCIRGEGGTPACTMADGIAAVEAAEAALASAALGGERKEIGGVARAG